MRVLVVGASNDRGKYGYKAVRAYLRQGHVVLPVNPRGGEIEGIPAYRTVADAPGPIDRATLYVPPAIGSRVVDELAERGDVAEVWFNPGSESQGLVAKAEALGLHPIVACSILAIGEQP